MTTYASDDLKKILALHRKWWFGEPDGVRADLSSADLRGADLRGADLRSADLRGAALRGADLSGADLRSADLSSAALRGADLRGADLSSADLRSADLRGAALSGADLSGAWLSDGVRWDEYLSDLVPALLVAGGRTLAEVATPEHWDCHSWNGDTVGCPMAVAFGARGLSDIPALYRGQAERFIQLFDARLIPLPTVPASV